jgi:hypothetical protein
MEFLPATSRDPGAIRFSPDIIVTHTQDHGLWHTLAAHYHNGRACGGFMLHNPARSRLWLAILFAASLRRDVLRVSNLALRECGYSSKRRAVRMVPVRVLASLHAFGIVVGLLFGGGNSRYKLD